MGRPEAPASKLVAVAFLNKARRVIISRSSRWLLSGARAYCGGRRPSQASRRSARRLARSKGRGFQYGFLTAMSAARSSSASPNPKSLSFVGASRDAAKSNSTTPGVPQDLRDRREQVRGFRRIEADGVRQK